MLANAEVLAQLLGRCDRCNHVLCSIVVVPAPLNRVHPPSAAAAIAVARAKLERHATMARPAQLALIVLLCGIVCVHASRTSLKSELPRSRAAQGALELQPGAGLAGRALRQEDYTADGSPEGEYDEDMIDYPEEDESPSPPDDEPAADEPAEVYDPPATPEPESGNSDGDTPSDGYNPSDGYTPSEQSDPTPSGGSSGAGPATPAGVVPLPAGPVSAGGATGRTTPASVPISVPVPVSVASPSPVISSGTVMPAAAVPATGATLGARPAPGTLNLTADGTIIPTGDTTTSSPSGSSAPIGAIVGGVVGGLAVVGGE